MNSPLALPLLRPAARRARDAADTLLQLLGARIPALDGVRGLAIILVLLHQFNIVRPGSSLPARLLTAVVEPGWIGVQLFFVLSGFLITGTLLDSKASPRYFSTFYLRRFLRIFPLYYLILAVTFVLLPWLTPLLGSPAPAGHPQPWYWLYLQNWLPVGQGIEPLAHTWSLAVEEQYYLLWPVAVWSLSRRGLVRLSVGLVFGALILRVVLRAADVAPGIIYMCTATRADALAMGGLAAIALRRADWLMVLHRRLRPTVALALVALGAVVIAGHDLARKNVVTQTVGYSVLSVVFAQLIIVIMLQTVNRRGRLLWLLSFGPLRAVGRVSYGMYLFHFPLHLVATRVVLVNHLDGDGSTSNLVLAAAYPVVGFAALFGLARLSWRLYEKRFLLRSPGEPRVNPVPGQAVPID
jgi:peptidoglycan/LPS O-acetylase OafA/YrhL